MRPHQLLLVLAACLVTFTSSASARSTWDKDDLYLVDVWQTEDGLPQNSATSITQMPDGYLWFGTFNGLTRFDGVRFEVFDQSNQPELPSATILAVHTDSKGRLWVGTEKGITCREDGRWRTYGEPEGWREGDLVVSFTEDREGRLWAGARSGRVVSLEGMRLVEMFSLPFWAQLVSDSSGRIWAAGRTSFGHFENGNWVELERHTPQEPAFTGIARSSDGGIWLHEQDGLRKYVDGRWTTRFKHEIVNDHRGEILEDSAGNVWGGTTTAGLFCYRADGSIRRYTEDNGLPDNSIRQIYEDSEANIWVGTDGGGLVRFKRRIFRSFTKDSGLPVNTIKSVAEDDSGYWVGTHGGGLARLEDNRIRLHGPAGSPPGWIWSVFVDRGGGTWVGAFADGLFRVRPAGFERQDLGIDGRLSVHVVYEDSTGRIWVGADRGLFQLSGPERRHITRDKRFNDVGVRAVAEGPAGELWLGTVDSGLFQLYGDRLTQYRAADGLGADQVRSLLADRDGTVWIGTYGEGLTRLRDGTFTRFTEVDGLPARNIISILDDELDAIWLGTNVGVIRCPREELKSFAAGVSESLQLRRYTKSDGLPSVECSGGNYPTGLRDSRGRLWFPTVKGLAVADPSKLEVNAVPPPVHIEEVLADDAVVELGEHTTLPLGARHVEFRYTAVGLRSPEAVTFQVRLDGFDDDWVPVGGRRWMRYTNLPPGSFRFHVRAANEDGYSDRNGVEMVLQVPHFYSETLWFRLLITGLFGLLAIGGYQLRMGSVRRRNRELKLLADASSRFVHVPGSEIENAIRNTLKEVAGFAGFDAAIVSVFNEDMTAFRCVVDWTDGDLPSVSGRLCDEPVTPDEGWLEKMKRHEICFLPSREAISQQVPHDRGVLESLGVRSLVDVPLVHSGRLIGFTGWASLRERKNWSEGTISVLRVVSEVIGNTLARRDYEAQLETARKAAEAANEAKSQFLANMSHEIRTPLNGILGMIQIMQDDGLPPNHAESADAVTKSAQALLEIVNDVLDFSKIEQGKVDIQHVPFDLRLMAEDLTELMTPSAREKGIELTLFFDADAPSHLIGDPGRIRQVLLNFVGNAIKFTEQGQVVVEVWCLEKTSDSALMKISVHDTGIGIPKDKLPLLFTRFTQLDSSASRKHEGAGLGLTISHRLVKLMGGEISVTSEPGEGSCFAFRVRLELDQSAQQRPPEASPLVGKKILVAHGDDVNRATLMEHCALWLMRVSEASSAESAEQMLVEAHQNADPYTFLLLGDQLPEIGGEQFVRGVRQLPELKDTTVVLVVPAGQRREAARFREAGCDACLISPVRASGLHDTLASLQETGRPGQPGGFITVDSRSDSDPKEAPQVFHGARALLVEDNIINQKVGANLLRRLGLTVDLASTGEQALRMMERRYDIIFMDCQMPRMDGFEATRRIRADNSEASNTPVVAMTAHAIEGDRERCLAAGMDDYVSKPVELAKLRRVLARWLPVRGSVS